MQALPFEHSVVAILKRDQRFDAQAYLFLKEALDFTLKRHESAGNQRHVSGGELCAGFRDLALEQFGPMASTLMEEWGVRGCEDIGAIVFLLIEEQIFGKQDSDTPEDFTGHFDLRTELGTPFLPAARNPPPSKQCKARGPA
ncbi:MAG: Minf_1886 family protein [Verrucomicrobiota bacterium]